MPEKQIDQELAVLDRNQQVMLLVRSGYTLPGIASHLGISEETVKNIMKSEMGRLTLEMQELSQWWTTLSLSRTEELYRRVFGALMEANDSRSIADLTKTALQVMKLQKEILGSATTPKEQNNLVQNNVVNHFTFTAGSPLYQEALEEIQTDMSTIYPSQGEVVDVASEDDRFAKLEARINKVLPDDSADDE